MRRITTRSGLAATVGGLAAVAASGCSLQAACGNAETDTDIRVSVVDAANGLGVCGAMVATSNGTKSYPCYSGDAADASGDADLEASGCWYDCPGSGAPGTTLYTVSVTAPGFEVATVPGVPIDMARDSCGLTTVEGQSVVVALRPSS